MFSKLNSFYRIDDDLIINHKNGKKYCINNGYGEFVEFRDNALDYGLKNASNPDNRVYRILRQLDVIEGNDDKEYEQIRIFSDIVKSEEVETKIKIENPLIPNAVQIDIESYCNFDCIFCIKGGSKGYREKLKLNMVHYRKLFSELESLGVRSINFSGGEPFFNKDFIDILKLTTFFGFEIIIFTNGSLITEDYQYILKKIRLQKLRISIYGNQDDYLKITKRDNYKDVFDNISALERKGIEFTLELAIIKQNEKSLPFFNKLRQKYKNVDWYYQIDSPLFYTQKNYLDEFSYSFDECKIDKYRHKLDGKYKSEYTQENPKKCILGSTAAYIDVEGSVYPCTSFPIPVGSLHLNSFSEIWLQSISLNKLREFNLNYVYEQCCECKYDTYGIRCPALNLIYCGDMKKLSKFRCEQCKFMYLEQHRVEMKEHDE